jgi:hypothetical protein
MEMANAIFVITAGVAFVVREDLIESSTSISVVLITMSPLQTLELRLSP